MKAYGVNRGIAACILNLGNDLPRWYSPLISVLTIGHRVRGFKPGRGR
jgi:hypothetical protein